MLKYVSKFFLEIFPSIIATVVGAYIVNHYIISKPDADAPKAAVASTPDPAKDIKAEPAATEKAGGPDKGKQAAAPTEKAAEKAAADKSSADKPSAEKDVKRQAIAREKIDRAAAKTIPAVNPPPAPVTVSIAPADIASATDDNRDANEIARAALDRLRGPVEATRQPDVRQPEPPRAPAVVARPADPPRVTVAVTPPQIQPPPQPHVQQTIQPLPPAVLVTAPSAGQSGATDDTAVKPDRPMTSFRLSPPADIPDAPPLDLQAAGRGRTSVTEDVVSAARSVFNAVIPR